MSKKLIDLLLQKDDYDRIMKAIQAGISAQSPDPMVLALFDGVMSEEGTYKVFRATFHQFLDNNFNKEEQEYVAEQLDDPIVQKVSETASNFTTKEPEFAAFHEYLQTRVKEVYDEYCQGAQNREE